MTIKRNVDFILKVKKMSRKDLADILGVTPQTVGAALSAKNVGLETINKIARALKVKPGDVIASPPLASRRYYKPREENEPDERTFVELKCPHCGEPIRLYTE